MAETFNQPAVNYVADGQAKDGKQITTVADGQVDENVATKDPSGKLLESTQTTQPTKVAEANAAPDSGMSYTEMGLLAGAFVAGAYGQKYGLNREFLSMAGRGIETLKTAATGVADLAPYARFAQRNVDTLGTVVADRLRGTLRLGGEIIDKDGKVFMGRDGTVVSTVNANFLGVSPVNAINRYGDAAQFLRDQDGVHSLATTIGRGPIRGFDVQHEANTLLGDAFSTTTIRDGNKVAKVAAGEVVQGKGLFSAAQIEAAIRQGQATTNSLYKSVLQVEA